MENETEPLATFEYISGTFNDRYIDADTRFIEGIPKLVVLKMFKILILEEVGEQKTNFYNFIKK